MIYPTGYLINTATQRIHPISFRMAPLPGNADGNSTQQRYKSAGHHTDGFVTMSEAQQFVAAQENMHDTGDVWDWDGKDIPTMVAWFNAIL